MTEPAATAPGQPGDLADWQRLSPWAVGFIFSRIVFDFVRNNLPALAGAGAGVALIERVALREAGLIALGLLLAVGLGCLIYHRRFRYCLEGDTLRVRRGLIERTELKVRASRIQHLAIEQPLYLRLFGLVRLSVDTPGGAAAQVELPGIRADIARTLRARLAEHGDSAAAASAGAAAAAPRKTFLAQPNATSLHGVASNHAYVFAAALAPFAGQIEMLLRWLFADTAWAEPLRALGERPFLAGTLLVAGALLLLVAISVIVSLLRYYSFELTAVDGRFRQHSGLLGRQEQTLARPRLQAVEHIQTAVGRLLGRSHLVCRQVGAVLPGQETGPRSFLIPGLAHDQAQALVGRLWPGLPAGSVCERVHRYYIRAITLRIAAAGTALLALLAVSGGSPWPLALLPLVVLIAWPLAWLRWRAVGFCLAAGHMQVRYGLIGQSTVVFPLARVQRLARRQSWFQRRRGVADLTFTLASGPVTIPCLPAAEADRLANLALYTIATRAAAVAGACCGTTG